VGSGGEGPESGPVFFGSPAEWRSWLADHHATATQILVGFHKTHTGRPTMTWAESVAEALCFGWIDGVRRSLGPEAYTIRFTPRRPGSHWSRVNIDLVARLEQEGRMTDAGRAAFAARREDRTGRFSYEQGVVAFDAEQEASFHAEREAWEWFSAQPPSYRKVATYWVTSAKREQTRERRLHTLITCSRERRRLPQTLPQASSSHPGGTGGGESST
jgi:uncharacterized protein YdeI (YjbR/CyaY-like superfamily)